MALVSACGRTDIPRISGTPSIRSGGTASDTQTRIFDLLFARVPYASYADVYRDNQELMDYLSAGTGLKVGLQLYGGYAEMVGGIRDGQVELAWLGPLSYLEAEDRLRGNRNLRILPIIKPARRGRADYVSEIIVRKDSGIDSVAALAGRSMAFVDTESTAGYLLAAGHLIRSGISPQDPLLIHPHFVKQYGNVVLSVLFRKFDAGAVFEGAPGVFLKDLERGRRDELKVIARSDSVPYEPIAAIIGGRLPAQKAEQIRGLFLRLSTQPDMLQKLQVDDFVRAEPGEYEPIRHIVETVRRIPKEATDVVR